MHLGLNLNSLGLKGSLGERPNFSSGQDFDSHLKKDEMSSNSFSGKPTPMPAQSQPSIPDSPSVTGPSSSMERVLPPSVSKPGEGGAVVSPSIEISKVDPLSKRVAWQQFLQKMKSELDVSAEDIMDAFQSLTPEELAMPPQKNVEKLVESLGLNPEQSLIASQLFKDLLQKTGSQPLAQELKTSGQDISLSVLSQKEQDQKRVSDSIDKMNEKFFMKSENQNRTDEKSSDSSIFTVGGAGGSKVETLSSGQEVSGELLAKMTPVSAEEGLAIARRLEQVSGEQIPENVEVAFDPLAPRQEAAMRDQVHPFVNVKNEGATEEVDAAEGEMGELEKSLSALLKKSSDNSLNSEKTAVKPRLSDSSDLSSKNEGESSSFSSNFSSNIPLEGMSEAVIDRSTFESALGHVGKADLSTAISTEELIREAQVMIKDGGGEMKVMLDQEGLGEIAMKVSVNGDKVNVEMITQNDTAKKLLEKSMGDLRGHLQASNLNLESIKVDTASQMGQQLEQQYQDAQRQQAQMFMENFRQGNQDFRRDFFGLPGARSYQSQTRAKAPDVEAAQGASKSGDGRRLNLVA